MKVIVLLLLAGIVIALGNNFFMSRFIFIFVFLCDKRKGLVVATATKIKAKQSTGQRIGPYDLNLIFQFLFEF